MITLTTKQYVPGVTAHAAYRFLTTLNNRGYRTWWPGTHLRAIRHRSTPELVGSVFFFDQYIGDYRVRAAETILEADPDRYFLRQVLVCGVRMPVHMSFAFAADDRGVLITHTFTAGFSGLGRILDPAFRLYFTPRFIEALDRHVKDELVMLRNLLPAGAAGLSTGLPLTQASPRTIDSLARS